MRNMWEILNDYFWIYRIMNLIKKILYIWVKNKIWYILKNQNLKEKDF